MKSALETLRRVARLQVKPVLRRADFQKHSGMSVNTLKVRFKTGSWRAILERAGLGHMYGRKV